MDLAGDFFSDSKPDLINKRTMHNLEKILKKTRPITTDSNTWSDTAYSFYEEYIKPNAFFLIILLLLSLFLWYRYSIKSNDDKTLKTINTNNNNFDNFDGFDGFDGFDFDDNFDGSDYDHYDYNDNNSVALSGGENDKKSIDYMADLICGNNSNNNDDYIPINSLYAPF